MVLILSVKHSCGLQAFDLSTCTSFFLLRGKIPHTTISNPSLIRVSFKSYYAGQLGCSCYHTILNFSVNGDSNFRLFRSLISLKMKFPLSYLLDRFELSNRHQVLS